MNPTTLKRVKLSKKFSSPQKESIMKKTSRRSFGKQLTGALAALSAASLGVETSAKARTAGGKALMPDNHSHQDTPPPIIFEEGSLKLDVLDRNLSGGNHDLPPDGSGAYKWEFPKQNANNDIFIVGVNIVDSAGKVWFYLDRDRVDAGEKRNPISILVHLEGSDSDRKEVVLSTNGKYATFKVPQSRELRRNHQNGTPIPDPPSTNRMRFRYLDGNGNAGNYHVKAIAIAIGPLGQHSIVSRIKLSDLPGGGADMKVMVWFEDVTH